jgi:hypothetical protein
MPSVALTLRLMMPPYLPLPAGDAYDFGAGLVAADVASVPDSAATRRDSVEHS